MTKLINRVTKLPKCESLFYFLCWTSAVFYSIYKVSLLSTYFNDYHDVYDDFSQGWIWLGRKQDVSDQEWKIWIPLIIKLIPWIFLHHSISYIIKTLPNTMLRCISCSIDNKQMCLENNYDNIYLLRNFLWGLAYSLYLPTLHLGPLILYHEFIDSIKKPFHTWKLTELGYLVLNLIRYGFWILFANFFLHFLYFNAMHYHPRIVEVLNPWALYGLGYCMGQFFLIKYVVVYGLNHTLCAIDNIEAPSQPKCVARVHLYSDMWKYFDEGLYKFLIRYIYTPLLKSNFNKVFASFLCFAFVFVWHGMQTNIFIWAFLNFIGLNIENLIKSLERSKYCTNIQKKYMSPTNVRRVHCIVTSPLLAMSVISNFYFFAGEEIGHIYVYRIFHDICHSTLILLCFLYCCCQVSTDLKNWESRKF
ncbi:protein-cysteine N-palmitoyltransferase Rasp isoform X2 [Nomia melanderi]|uniref:protein-cysteine N-palmitoyltransferase Rasp isoform X2 n=1 Tax=Nomia melanderi TaxID=2448451 RepID=UPI00130443A1|nr:protein-cysteine N-palmitoyltransferase HHAT isoform X2 [Nomia melanderi]